MTQIEELVHPAVADGSIKSKFDSKMTDKNRCEALALLTLGYTGPLVARLFGVHSRTAGQISRASSPNYKRVRRLMAEMGRDAFIKLYASPDLVQRANALVNESQLVRSGLDNTPTVVASPSAHREATSREGEWALYGHKVLVSWRAPPEAERAGWFYEDLAEPGVFFGPHTTSKAAYDTASNDLGMM